MRRFSPFLAVAGTLLLSSPLLAQDFGKSWIDRVTHELIEDEGALSPRPVEFTFTAGELYTYDSNIFLTHTDRTSDSIFTTFVGGNVKTATTNFDAEADVLVNYNAYVSTKNVNADEERFFGRARYQGTQFLISLAEIARREVSPTDAVFTTRVPRFLSNTTPLVVFKATEVLAIEVTTDLMYLDYLRTAFSAADNFNSRSIFTVAYTTGWNNIEILGQGGYWEVSYRDPTSPPDAHGYIARTGIRGELTPRFHVVALGGFTTADSNDFPGTNQKASLTTADIEIHIAYTPNETTTLFADYSRRFGFSGEGGAPFQTVDYADLIAEKSLRDDLKVRGRLEYSRVSVPSPLDLRRAYYSAGVGTEYKIHPHVALDAGLTYRWGVVPGSASAGDFADFLLSVGAAVLF
jgi:hypothetical protein